nr:MAG TPA: hypothetical protein [Caudoviricetes sp.]
MKGFLILSFSYDSGFANLSNITHNGQLYFKLSPRYSIFQESRHNLNYSINVFNFRKHKKEVFHGYI